MNDYRSFESIRHPAVLTPLAIVICICGMFVAGCESQPRSVDGRNSSSKGTVPSSPDQAPVAMELDPRLVGAWQAKDATVERITIEETGDFTNTLHPGSGYPDGIGGTAKTYESEGSRILTFELSASGKNETQAYEFNFEQDAEVLVLKFARFPPNQQTSSSVKILHFPAGFALARVEAGVASDAAVSRVIEINQSLEYHVEF